jgi:opacity protein-like surface antigen
VTPQVLNSGGIAEPTTGDCTGNYKANLSSYDVLANVYVDLGTWSSVTPYVGAGVGLSFGHYSTSSTYIQGNGSSYNVSYTSQGGSTTTEDFDRTGSGTYYNFAWALMSGVGIDVYSHTKLDIGYRYLNLGKISGISGTLYSNEVRVGLRYMIDN